MEPKKNPKVATEPKQKMYAALGLCLSLSFVIVAFEWKTTESEIMSFNDVDDPFDPTIEVIQTKISPPKPPKPKVIQPVIKETEEEIEEEDIDVVFEDFDEEIPEVKFEEEVPEEVVPTVFEIVEQMPSPVGGMEAFYEHLRRNLKYPRQAVTMGVEGKVFVQFIVSEDGTLREVTAVKGIHSQCDAEAVKVIKSFPGWNPGKQRGKPVSVRIMMPITFRLQ